MSGKVDSNRLDASHANERIIGMLRQRFSTSLRDRNGRELPAESQHASIRFLEKTPKNALRQPFLEKIFPGALYVWLYRDPRPNISSMMEAWKAGRWVTYPRLRGWRGPAWSLLLPPGWQKLSGRPLPEICAFQWEAANRIILDDLSALSPDRWIACDYENLTERSNETIEGICDFAGLEMDEHLRQHISEPLPLSRYTHTAPETEKWRKNEEFITPQLESIEDTWKRCRAVLKM